MLDEAVGLGDGGVSLAGAGGHLEEGARAVVAERFFQAGDGGDLAVAERCGVQLGEVSKPGAEGIGLLDELDEVLRPVESEDGARAGVGIALVAEVRLDAGGLVGEGQRIRPALRDPLFGVGVAFALLGDPGERGACFLRLDHAKGLAIDEEDIVGGTALRLKLADGDTATGGEV